MLRMCVTFVCILSLVVSAGAQGPGLPVQQQVSRLSKGSYISVESKNGNLIKGRLLSSKETTFEIQPDGRKSIPVSLAYEEVQSVKRHRLTPGRKKALIITGAIVGGMIILGTVCGSGGCIQN